MNTVKTYVSLLVITLATLFSFTSCEEDWYESYPYAPIDGEWRIVGVNGYNSNYREGDVWCFYHNGDFEARGYDLFEEGYWDLHRNSIYISFDTYDPEIEAYIVDYEGDYLILDVRDYGYDGKYTLRLVRESFYGQEKEK